jgi:hypothetical protein
MKQNSDSNLNGSWMRMALCVLALMGTSSVVVAQQTPDQQAPSTGSQDVKPVVLATPTYSQNIALLGTDQRYVDLGTLQTRRRNFLMYGMGFSESYYDNFEENIANQDGSEFLWSPHVAIVNASNHSSFSFQYAPTLAQSTSGPSTRQVFHTGTITFGQPIARNWVLQLSSTNTYGTDATRLLSPLAFSVGKGVPVVDPNAAVFELNRGKVFTTANIADLSWQRNPSQSMNFSVQESYFSSPDNGQSSRSTFAQASYSVAVSPRTTFNLGANYFHQVFSFSAGSCDGYGVSIGVSHQIGHHINLTAGGGPEFVSAPCKKGLGGNYGISISYPLSRRSRVGLTASRSYTTNYLPNTQSSDTASVSYERQLSEYFEVSIDSGYVRSVRTIAGLGAYVGYFAGAELSWKLTRTVSLGTAYRRFQQVSGGPNLGQNVALISLGWNPLPMRVVK